MGTAEIHPEDPFFPAAAAVLIEHCLEQQGFPPLTSYYDERRSLYLPELLLPGCLHTQVKHLVQVFRLSLQWGGQDHNSCVRRAGLEVGVGLATYPAGPPTHCPTSAVHSPSWLLFPREVQEGERPGFALRLLWDLSEH